MPDKQNVRCCLSVVVSMYTSLSLKYSPLLPIAAAAASTDSNSTWPNPLGLPSKSFANLT